MWEVELRPPQTLSKEIYEEMKLVGSRENWYKNSNNYWNNVTQDVSGMLQGLEGVSDPDLKFSSEVLDKYIKEGKLKAGKVLDCGGGVGRISKGLLINFFETVDIVDQAPNLIAKAKESIKSSRMRNYFVSGLQDFTFNEKYDCIWIQWVLTHITDTDAIKFLKNCKENLNENVFYC